MIFSIFGAQMSGAEFQFPDLIWKETTSKMAIRLQKVGVTRANFPISWKPIVLFCGSQLSRFPPARQGGTEEWIHAKRWFIILLLDVTLAKHGVTHPNPCISHGLYFYSLRGAEAFRGLGDNFRVMEFFRG